MTDEKPNAMLRAEELRILEKDDIVPDGTTQPFDSSLIEAGIQVGQSEPIRPDGLSNDNQTNSEALDRVVLQGSSNVLAGSEKYSNSQKNEPENNKLSADNSNELVDLGDRYQVIDFIGSGASGRVYKAYDKDLDQILAVKVLKRELLSDAQAVKRFEQEAISASSLSHENIVAVYGYGSARDGSPFITMRFVDGESLSKRLSDKGPVPLRSALKLFIQICGGLESAHLAGIVHRDLKPSNIIIENNEGSEHSQILDFGIAKVVSASADTFNTLTANGQFLGTPTYMSPEQCLGEAIDYKSDIYALGCMLYEVVAGETPFARANPIELIAKKIGDELVIPAHERIDSNLLAVISCAMERNPKERYDSTNQMAKDLIDVYDGKAPTFARQKLRLDTGMLGKRILASLIDGSVCLTFAGCLYFAGIILAGFFGWIAGMLFTIFGGSAERGADFFGFLFLLFYLFGPVACYIVYNPFFERLRGATPGKQFLNMKICDAAGKRISWGQAWGRNALKAVILILVPITGIGIPIILYSLIRSSQLPWDVASGCYVRSRK